MILQWSLTFRRAVEHSISQCFFVFGFLSKFGLLSRHFCSPTEHTQLGFQHACMNRHVHASAKSVAEKLKDGTPDLGFAKFGPQISGHVSHQGLSQ